MKRKFSSKLAPIKVPTDEEEEYTMDGVDSPQFSPVSFIIERPHLSPQTYLDLQRSCASIVQEIQPVDHQVYETIAASHKNPRKWSDDNQAYKTITQAPNPKPKTHRRTDSGPSLAPKPYTHIPTNAATSFTATATSRKPSYALEPPSPTHAPAFPSPPTTTTRTRPLAHLLPDLSHDPLAIIRADLSSRPKTSAAACIDYQNPPSTTTTTTTTTTTSTSKSTTRTNTTYDAPPAANTSTGLTSLSPTPYSSRLSSSHPPPPGDTTTSATAAATAKAWMAQELARRRSSAEKASAILQPRSPQHRHHSSGALPPRPCARGSVSEPGPHRDDPERAARSRSNSISQGIREYIRPRASVDSLRTSHSSSDLLGGSGAHAGGNKWWAPAALNLKRKNSWSSFRSAGREDGEGGEGKGGSGAAEVDLNRALPRLPGLETWREERRRPVHVGLMVRRGVGGGKDDEMGRKAKERERATEADARKGAGEGRARGRELGAAKETRGRDVAVSGGKVSGSFEERMRKREAHEQRTVVEPKLQDIHPLLRPQRGAFLTGEGEVEGGKKGGLRKKLSRFWGRGRGRAGGKELPVAVVAN